MNDNFTMNLSVYEIGLRIGMAIIIGGMIGYERVIITDLLDLELIYLYVWEQSSSFYGAGSFENKHSQICYGKWKCSSGYKN